MHTHAKKIQVPILMYHSISNSATPNFKQFTIPPAVFASQMAYLYQQAYTPITVSQFIDMRSQGTSALPERPIVITFDDGFVDFYTEALPVLRRYGFTATLYVATAFVNGTSLWLEREKETMRLMLTWQQLREISTQGIECGAHSHNHRRLSTLPRSVVRDEIIKSKKLLEYNLGRQVTSFAYPYGYQTTMIRQLVQEIGFTSACAVEYTISSESTDPFALARLMVKADTDLNAFAALVTEHRLYSLKMLYARTRTSLWQVILHGFAMTKMSIPPFTHSKYEPIWRVDHDY